MNAPPHENPISKARRERAARNTADAEAELPIEADSAQAVNAELLDERDATIAAQAVTIGELEATIAELSKEPDDDDEHPGAAG